MVLIQDSNALIILEKQLRIVFPAKFIGQL